MPTCVNAPDERIPGLDAYDFGDRRYIELGRHSRNQTLKQNVGMRIQQITVKMSNKCNLTND